MARLRKQLAKLIRGEEGASFTEYGLLLVVVVFALGVTATVLATDITTFLNNIGTALTSGNIPNPLP